MNQSIFREIQHGIFKDPSVCCWRPSWRPGQNLMTLLSGNLPQVDLEVVSGFLYGLGKMSKVCLIAPESYLLAVFSVQILPHVEIGQNDQRSLKTNFKGPHGRVSHSPVRLGIHWAYVLRRAGRGARPSTFTARGFDTREWT